GHFESLSRRRNQGFLLSAGRSRCPDQCCRQLFRTGIGRTRCATRHSKRFVCLALSVLFFRWYFFSQLVPRSILALWNDQGKAAAGPALPKAYGKRSFGGPAEVLRYLARYTHRVAISNRRRLVNGVTFKWKNYRLKGRER